VADRDDSQRSIENRLEHERALPDPGFLGRLERHLLALEAEGFARPPNLSLLIGIFAGCGGILLAIAIAGVLGSGPLAG
jgi:hypothetical protein